jgi:hypothetical protein
MSANDLVFMKKLKTLMKDSKRLPEASLNLLATDAKKFQGNADVAEFMSILERHVSALGVKEDKASRDKLTAGQRLVQVLRGNLPLARQIQQEMNGML